MKNTFIKTVVILMVTFGILYGLYAIQELRNNFPDAVSNFQYMQRLQAYQVYTIDNVTYSRYQSGSGNVFIVKETIQSGTGWNLTTYEKTMDTWANKITATYEEINTH